jgi:hypothetical protein
VMDAAMISFEADMYAGPSCSSSYL